MAAPQTAGAGASATTATAVAAAAAPGHVPNNRVYRVFLGWDHAVPPFVHEGVIAHLGQSPRVRSLQSFGPREMTNAVDYPDIAFQVCSNCSDQVLEDPTKNFFAANELPVGILICGSGIGMSIAANKYPGIRAALCHDYYTAHMCRKHNNANVMCCGARTTGLAVITEMIDAFLENEFAGPGKHQVRVGKIDEMDRRTHAILSPSTTTALAGGCASANA